MAGDVAAPRIMETPSSFFESSLTVGSHNQYISRRANSGDDLGFATASVGYIFYPFFDDADDTQEVYFGLSRECSGFETGIEYFWDIETDNQGCPEANIAKSFGLGGFGLDTGVAVGCLVEGDALSNHTAKGSHDIKLGESAMLGPYVACALELDDLEQYGGRMKRMSSSPVRLRRSVSKLICLVIHEREGAVFAIPCLFIESLG